MGAASATHSGSEQSSTSPPRAPPDLEHLGTAELREPTALIQRVAVQVIDTFACSAARAAATMGSRWLRAYTALVGAYVVEAAAAEILSGPGREAGSDSRPLRCGG